MQHSSAKRIRELIASYFEFKQDTEFSILKILTDSPLTDFDQWADGKPLEGAFCLQTRTGRKFWLLLIEWNKPNGYYVVLYPENKSGPKLEIHQEISSAEGQSLVWLYRPVKHDGKNDIRKRVFEKNYPNCEAVISLPTTKDEVTDFLIEISTLFECRILADDLTTVPLPVRDSFPEGKRVERLHIQRERNSALIKEVKERYWAENGKLDCACCGFDFSTLYGGTGVGFIEAHHTTPLSELHNDGEETRPEDIALVCSNCHRMLHRRRPWLSTGDLKKIIQSTER